MIFITKQNDTSKVNFIKKILETKIKISYEPITNFKMSKN